MGIEQYINVLLKRWKLIFLCFVVMGLGAYIGSRLITPQYQATAIIQVMLNAGTNQSDINSLLASDQLVQTETQLAISDPVLRAVSSHYPGLTVDQLMKTVSALPKPNTQLFEIDVLNSDANRAAALANDVAQTLIQQQVKLMSQNRVRSQQQLQQQLQQMQADIDKAATQLAVEQKNKAASSDIITLTQRLDNLHQSYDRVQIQLDQLQVIAAQNDNFLHIVQPAQRAVKPAKPDIMLNTVIGLVGGLFVGLLLAMLFEQMDTRIHTEEALSQLMNWPILATIWRQHTLKARKGQDLKLHKGDDDSQVSPERGANIEAYRILRTNIGFSLQEKRMHSMIVVSATQGDGKSTIAANLAIYMAKAGKKTLLIDADLRRPTLDQKFHLSTNKLGLSNAVLDGYEYYLDTTVPSMLQTERADSFSLQSYMHAVDIPNLQVMPAGLLPPNPPELLDSKAMDHFFIALKSVEADVIIFDTPPLLGLSDANILVQKVDSVLVVIDITSANKKSLQHLKAILKSSGKRVLGCIVNKQNPSRKHHPYVYSYYDYDKKYDRSQESKTSPF